MLSIFAEIGVLSFLIIAVCAIITSSIHGATGVAGGFLMTAVLAVVIGVKPVVPIMSVALLISHSSRALLNIRDFDRDAFLNVAIPAVPFIIAGALIYGKMSSSFIAILLGTVILIFIPVRRWAASRRIVTGRGTLSAAAAIYGGLSGVSIGPGMLLVPFMLGYGLNRQAFVATLAVVALVTNVTRLSVFGQTDLLDSRYLILGLLIGLLTIPGNWIGRSILQKMNNDGHTKYVEILMVVGALNFFMLALR